MASIEIITNAWPVRDVLPLLLFDRSAKKNIIFATESYADRGEGYGAKIQITEQVLNIDGGCIIQPRVLKDSDEQLLRTRRKAEVFTPAWVCCLMNNHIDEVWFGRPDVFGTLNGQEWTPAEDPVLMPKRRRWQAYIDSRRLEITCGEAPYLVSRYDMATGEIIPINERIGILDRKLRIVNENAQTEEEWLKWAQRAFQSVYGYEYQGDNLLIARINLLLTYIDYIQDRWDRKPTDKELNEIAKIISWNIWQMDGLKGSIPLGALYEEYHQMTIFDIFGCDGLEDFKALTGFTFRGMVHPGDYEGISASIKEQVQASQADFDSVEYRIIRKDGEVRWIDDYGHYIEYDDGSRGLYYVFISDITERHAQAESDKALRSAVIEALTRAYDSVWLINDIEKQSFELFRVDPDMVHTMPANAAVKIDRFSQAFAFYSKLVYEADRQRFLDAVAPENIVRNTEDKPLYSVPFRRVFDDGIRHYRVEFAKLDLPGGMKRIVAGFRNVDDEVRRGGGDD